VPRWISKCDLCEFKPFAQCEANGYKTKEMAKSNFEQQQEIQEEIDKLEQNSKGNKTRKRRKKK